MDWSYENLDVFLGFENPQEVPTAPEIIPTVAANVISSFHDQVLVPYATKVVY